MATAASAFLVLSLWLAVIIGPQMRMWPWGPALLALAAALACATVAVLRTKRPLLGPGTLILGLAVSSWFAWRAWTSPVAELAHADLLLLGATVGCFLVCRAIAHNARAEAVFLWGLAALLVASIAMIFGQLGDPEFSQFRSRPTPAATGFYAHYNEGANFLIGASVLLAGSALIGAHRKSVKCVWVLIAIAGLAAVYFTRSRGAVFGVIVGFVALSTFILVIGSKRKSSWFAPAMIAFPIILLASGFLLYFGWEKVQRSRSDGSQGVAEMMDNTSRLRNYSLSYNAIMLNPIFGGGSRSYSWNSLHVWDPKEHGLADHLPEQAHNEILQAATDYGLIGAGSVLALIGWLSLRGLWRCRFDEGNDSKDRPRNPSRAADESRSHVKSKGSDEGNTCRDALRAGAMGALAGMLVQSSFSFVFHLLPGAMLLGIALGRLAEPSTCGNRWSGIMPITLRASTALLAAILAASITIPGIAGTRVFAELAPIYYKVGSMPDDDARISKFSEAIAIWPGSELYNLRARIHHLRATDGASLELALADYLAAAQHHPKFPAHFVNAANLSSLTGDDDAAEALYEEAIQLQGNMEPAFRAHFHKAEHFRRKGIRSQENGDLETALRSMETALASFHELESKSAWLSAGTRELRNAIYQSLALTQEAAGDHRGARETLEAALKIRGNHEFRYHIAMLQYRRAMAVWHQRRPEAALPIFHDARNRLLGARNHPPRGVSREAIQAQIDSIDETLKFLREAGIRNE